MAVVLKVGSGGGGGGGLAKRRPDGLSAFGRMETGANSKSGDVFVV